VAGHSASEGGIVLDLQDMKTLDIDAQRGTAWVEAGLTAGEYTTAAGAYGLATGFGDTGSVRIGGLTLGGGVGYLVRNYGLTIDDLLAAEIVTADGQVLHTDAQTHPDLFWAIRGGGGNFGVATRLRFRLHPVGQVVGGLLLPATPEVIASFVAEAEAAPEELSTIANIMPAPPLPLVPAAQIGRLVIMATLVHAGPIEAGQRAVAPFRALATPIADLVRPMSYPEIYPPEADAFHPTAVARTMFVDRRPAGGRDDRRVPAGVRRGDAGGAAAGAGRGDGAGARRGHRLRPSSQPDHGQPGHLLRRPGGPSGAPGLGRRVRGGAAPAGRRRLRGLPGRGQPGAHPPGLPAGDLGAAGGGQGPLRPHQPVPPQSGTGGPSIGSATPSGPTTACGPWWLPPTPTASRSWSTPMAAPACAWPWTRAPTRWRTTPTTPTPAGS
jgi:hypothetical protein